MKEINSIEDINEMFGKEEIENSISSINSNNKQVKKGCKAGFTITNEIIEEDKLKSRVLKYITYKKRTENEIRQKFADVDENILDNVIEYFKSQNYINENDYIERSIKEFLAVKKLSIKELTYKLFQKGVDKKLLDNYIDQNREMLINYEIESAKKIITKKHYTMELQDIKKYLLQKGYMSETISIAIDEVIDN